MGLFLFCAIALIGITVLLLLRPWRSAGAERDAASVQDLNARIYRDQLAELDRDLAAGTLAPADHAQAGAELRRRLLEDTAETETATPEQVRRTRRTSLVLAVALPLAATGLYAWLGAPAALLPGAAQPQAAQHAPTAAEVDQMVAGLAARLEKNPNDPKGWSILARSYHALGRFAEAEAAFNRIGDDLNRDPVLLADYADTLASRAGGNLEGRPTQLAKAALQLDPDNAMALSLAAMGAFQRKDFAEAARHWQRLLPQLPPDSDEAKWVTKMLADSGAGGAGPGTTAASGVPGGLAVADGAAAPKRPAAGNGAAITGSVTLAPKLLDAVKPTDTVFVFARPVDGGRMPLAVQRARVADLPLQFHLDDSLAISPQAKLSDASEVRIEARISRSGNATPSTGDLFGVSATVKTTGTAPVTLQIDQVRP